MLTTPPAGWRSTAGRRPAVAKELPHWWRTRRGRSYTPLHLAEELAETRADAAAVPVRTGAGAAGPVEDWSRWTSRKLAGGVMSRLRFGRSSDSDGRDLLYAGQVQHAGPHHSTALMEQGEWCRSGRGWIG